LRENNNAYKGNQDGNNKIGKIKQNITIALRRPFAQKLVIGHSNPHIFGQTEKIASHLENGGFNLCYKNSIIFIYKVVNRFILCCHVILKKREEK